MSSVVLCFFDGVSKLHIPHVFVPSLAKNSGRVRSLEDAGIASSDMNPIFFTTIYAGVRGRSKG